MRYAIIEAGVVINVELHAAPPPGAVASDTANIGDTWDGSSFIPPPPPPPTSAEINGAIRSALAVLDAARVRPASEIAEALAVGHVPDPAAVARLVELNARAAELREGMVP